MPKWMYLCVLQHTFSLKYLAVWKKRCTFAAQKHRGVEQLVARQAHNLEVARSSRAPATRVVGQSNGIRVLGCPFSYFSRAIRANR